MTTKREERKQRSEAERVHREQAKHAQVMRKRFFFVAGDKRHFGCAGESAHLSRFRQTALGMSLEPANRRIVDHDVKRLAGQRREIRQQVLQEHLDLGDGDAAAKVGLDAIVVFVPVDEVHRFGPSLECKKGRRGGA